MQGRHAKDKGLAKIALEGIRKEMPVLHVDRFIETEMTNHTINLGLIGFRIDQHVHRITNHIDPDKHQQRHQKNNNDALQQTADDENRHVRRV